MSHFRKKIQRPKTSLYSQQERERRQIKKASYEEKTTRTQFVKPYKNSSMPPSANGSVLKAVTGDIPVNCDGFGQTRYTQYCFFSQENTVIFNFRLLFLGQSHTGGLLLPAKWNTRLWKNDTALKVVQDAFKCHFFWSNKVDFSNPHQLEGSN